jgi:hypothetical protein
VSHLIPPLLVQLLRLLLPAQGRHRLGGPAPAATSKPSAASHPLIHSPLRGEDCALVRPYLLTSQELRMQRQRRRAPWLATHGVDIGPRRIHGVEVTA